MNIFQEDVKVYSMRRVLAFVFAIVSVVAGLSSVFFRLEWQTVAAAFGVPALACLLLLFFTTWADVANIVNDKRG